MRVIPIISTQGGVGKTAIIANLGGLLADTGLRVLLGLPPIFTRATPENWREQHV